MAEKKNKKVSQAAAASEKAANAKNQKENRPEIIGLCCFIVAIFAVVCWFNTDSLLKYPINIIGGLFGQIGRYLLPFALAYVGIILLRSNGKAYFLRAFCGVTLLITVGGLVHIFVELFTGNEVTLNLKDLYAYGQTWQSAGVVSGLITEILERCVTKVGAIVVLLLAFALQILTCMRITVDGLITAIKNRPRNPRTQKPETEVAVDPAQRIVNKVATKHIERYDRRHPISEYDLPVDEPMENPTKSELAEPKKKRGKAVAPDEFLRQKQEEAALAKVDVVEKQITIDEIELSDPEPVDEGPELLPVTKRAPVVAELPVQQEVPIEKLKKGEAAASAAEISQEIQMANQTATSEYVFPPISLLNLRNQGMVDATAEMRENTRRLADALRSFGIEPHIVDVIRGPSVTRYELQLEQGVKLSKITNLADDIALSLGATGVRISAIPDKISVVGIEVPNKAVNVVYAREVIDSPVFRNSNSRISFAVGKDISGNCIVGDISKLPHMLIAGTTGSGKSVCMNTLIISLLYKARPDEVKLIMVDPKMVELGVYNGIPHLLIPVVTDPKKAAGALQWAVTEMMRRYRLMSEEGVRDIDSYNKAIVNDPDQQKMPRVVVVIDELADLMLVAAKEVEESICRIAQMGRASGIHLVIATQRPSADVITGLMKANIPSRIAFAVSSAMESRIILDTQGAEKLVGKGDMLFAPLGQGKPKRVQGCFITDDEVQSVVDAIKAQSSSNYSNEIMEQIEKTAEQGGKGGSAPDAKGAAPAEEGDELLPAAVEVILETGQASVSMLQRRLKLGYARAARIVDEMEEKGIVGPFEGAKPRQLLITREQWEQIQNGSSLASPPVEEEIP